MARIEPESESFGAVWGYRDLLYGMVVIFMAVASLAIYSVATPTKNSEVNNGLLEINIAWDWTNRDDVDLWVRSPTDAAVGYSDKQAAACSLLRDDLGDGTDPLFDNREVVICRKTPAGEYVVNLHEFGTHDRKFPVHVHVQVMKQGGAYPILKKDVDLTALGQQITVFRFQLDKDGTLVPGSVNDLYLPVRPETKGN